MFLSQIINFLFNGRIISFGGKTPTGDINYSYF